MKNISVFTVSPTAPGILPVEHLLATLYTSISTGPPPPNQGQVLHLYASSNWLNTLSQSHGRPGTGVGGLRLYS